MRLSDVHLRSPAIGEFGQLITRQALIYHQAYGFSAQFEAAAAEVVAGYLQGFDPALDRGWVADVGGRLAGSVFIIHTDQPRVARLRMLLVEPWAQGIGLGGGCWTPPSPSAQKASAIAGSSSGPFLRSSKPPGSRPTATSR